MDTEKIIEQLKSLYNKKNIDGMARFGINPKNTLGISVYVLRDIAKDFNKKISDEKTRHKIALELWQTGIHEARLLAPMIDVPTLVTEEQMKNWVKDFDSWDIVDQCCGNLFKDTRFAKIKIIEWSRRKEEFVKRTAFALICEFAYHDKTMKNKEFESYFSLIKRECTDKRNFVRKAVNWALRNIGKRNLALNKKAIAVAKGIKKINNKTAKWIANDALRELQSKKIQNRLKQRSSD